MSRVQRVAILGSTGSIGESTLNVIRENQDKYKAVALVANKSIEKIYQQSIEFRPEVVCLASEKSAIVLSKKLKNVLPSCNVVTGINSVTDIVSSDFVDSIMAGISGSQGLPSTIAAAQSGKRIMLANKESLVMAGALLISLVEKNNGLLLPTDSEHNAIFQSLPVHYRRDPSKHGVRKIILTASGGPFLNSESESLSAVTPEQACNHPRWKMGKKISVDSATLMNKGLEVIEAHHLFNVAPNNIEVVIHPESIVHSLVEYVDGSTLAQLGQPDMRIPIAYSLSFPNRTYNTSLGLSISDLGTLSFSKPDLKKFPCLKMAYQALSYGGSCPIYLNAANEEAVNSFLMGMLSFTSICEVIEDVLNKMINTPIDSLDDIMEAHRVARHCAQECIRLH